MIKSCKCSGLRTSQIGLQHGRAAKTEIGRGLRFYEVLFQETAKLSWSRVFETAAKFEPLLSSEWPDYCEEMKGMGECYEFHFLVIWFRICFYNCWMLRNVCRMFLKWWCSYCNLTPLRPSNNFEAHLLGTSIMLKYETQSRFLSRSLSAYSVIHSILKY